jgi:transposase
VIMRAYSYDLRTDLLRAIDQGMPKPEAARIFGVSTRTIERYQQRRRATGDVQSRPIPGRQRLITSEESAALWTQLERMPTATLAEHCIQWAAEQGVVVSTATMSRQIHRLGWTRKKGRWWPPKPMRPSGQPGGRERQH